MGRIDRLGWLCLALVAVSAPFIASPPDEMITGKVEYAGPCEIGAARNIIGTGTNGNDVVGPIALFGADIAGIAGDGFVITGHDAPYRATGGSLQNLRVVRKAGTNGGRAIVVSAADTGHRPGEVLLRRLKVFPESALSSAAAGRWADGVVIDGSALTTPGAAGIRRTTMDDVRVSSVASPGRAFFLNNAVHCCMTNVQVDPGGVPLAVFEIKDGQNIEGVNMIIHGDLIFTGTPVEVSLHGRFHTIRICGGARAVTIFGTTHFLYVEPGATGGFFGHVSEGVDNDSATFTVH